MPAVPDHLILQIQPGLVIAAIIVVAVGNGMSGLRGIAAKRVKGRQRRRRRSAGRYGSDDIRRRGSGVRQVACIEIGAQAVIG